MSRCTVSTVARDQEAMEKGQMPEREETMPLLNDDEVGDRTWDGSLDIHGKPALRHRSGGWRSSVIFMGVECCESLAYFGVSTNLVAYMGKTFHQGNATTASGITTWIGTSYLTPFLGALIADSYWGRYKTIFVSILIFLLGMIIVTFSAFAQSFMIPPCEANPCPLTAEVKKISFFSGLYLVAIGSGGLKSSLLPMGADQFEDGYPVEMEMKGSFFNWFYVLSNSGALFSSTLIVWMEEYVDWALGFAIATSFMALSLVGFLSGTSIYRLHNPTGSPLKRLLHVVIASVKKMNLEMPANGDGLFEDCDMKSIASGSRKLLHTNEFRFLDKAAIITASDVNYVTARQPLGLCTVTQVEELKIILRLLPIWLNSIVYFAVYSQMFTTFIEQGAAMNARIGRFSVPPASLFAFQVFSVMFLVLIYDKVVATIGKKLRGCKGGFTELQRMGIGRLLLIPVMVAAALLEKKRLEGAMSGKSLSIEWQLPQYFILGASEAFNGVGQLEFFYNQAPDPMKSMCIAFSLLTISLGSYLSSLIVVFISSVTTQGGQAGWIPDDLNEGHLDYFFWMLAGISTLNFVAFLGCAKSYKLKEVAAEED